MTVGEAVPRAVVRRPSRNQAALVAAYRQGLGLIAVAVIRGAGGVRIVAEDGGGGPAAGGAVAARRWCGSSAAARRVANAAMARLRRRQSRDDAPTSPAAGLSPASASSPALEAIAAAAERAAVRLYTEEEICAEAIAAAACVDQQMERLRQSGELKSVNRSYRIYRMEASARGEKIVCYADWFNQYRVNLVRQLAAALRYR